MSLLRKKKIKYGTIDTLLRHISGLEETFQVHQEVYVTWDENGKEVRFQNKIHKVFGRVPIGVTLRTVFIRSNRIKRIAIITKKEIREQVRNIGGKAVIGDFLIGPLVAIVDRVSGVSNTRNIIVKSFVVLNYDEDKVITLEIPLSISKTLNSYKIVNGVRSHLNENTEINL